ncbi:predicted protein [Meyerozyma guilliermondii ATCC 6260]|uniref:Uncharacterized protein n=1 Tax=Meyerozyma guilliermondii (strain ATCC 6260 / CBS 566 / DSM 6381 / JCM 1539 / NBRC 10279 / NRRL Y-324) TaxID=294746 RepID=A5DAF9_PICGU|nr:uncharacterized protein PGUG_00264 [Meyerozyma guilliermondii ATCC 6260]EDK36166.2 predicted protein [Meyerozyma guilliermondii ATCC 6260]
MKSCQYISDTCLVNKKLHNWLEEPVSQESGVFLCISLFHFITSLSFHNWLKEPVGQKSRVFLGFSLDHLVSSNDIFFSLHNWSEEPVGQKSGIFLSFSLHYFRGLFLSSLHNWLEKPISQKSRVLLVFSLLKARLRHQVFNGKAFPLHISSSIEFVAGCNFTKLTFFWTFLLNGGVHKEKGDSSTVVEVNWSIGFVNSHNLVDSTLWEGNWNLIRCCSKRCGGSVGCK